MPRYQAKAIEAKKQQQAQVRQFTHPWVVKPAPSGFSVQTATGFELFVIPFTPAEMREHFPNGMTAEEAQGLAQRVVEGMNRQGALSDPRSPDQLRREFYRGPPGTLKGRAVSGFR